MPENDIYNPLKSLKLIGLNNYFNDLIKLYDFKKFPKVLLISGKKGTGKFTMINHFLNYFFSKDTYNLKEKEISINSLVYQKQLNGVFQNIIHVKNEGRESAKIDDIRKLKSLLSKSSLNNDPRFVILDDVEKLNINSSNAILKIIEEPSESNFFILIDNQENKLIETISSRCLKINIFINKSERKEITDYLMKEKNIENVLNYKNSNISPGLFLRYNYLCLEHDISSDLSYLSKLYKLLNLYKKTKDEMFINLLIFLTDEYFYTLSLNKKKQILFLSQKKIEIINQINNFVKYNLNLNSVFNSIESQFNHGE